ncbi:hypothetical protein [Geomonas sp.]|uniref:hypothetical protein n=1 Tax=Geomonas sp. TaxID=2651584 RepID=UPI002B46C582|nr:hypothetical protein [Geomonas sp.]HJV34990.1 hypothetical protein [Geomonas sp.]
MDDDELARRTNPLIMVLERRKEEKEWNSAEVMRILRKRAAKRRQGETAESAGIKEKE